MVLVSIIMPAYNAEKYLSQSINSVLSQTEKNFELIIINDGSTDSSESIIERYKQKDSRVILINQPNSGKPAIARNNGIKHAVGEYICFLDADDFYDHNRIEKQLSIFKEFLDVSVVFHDISVVDENSNMIVDSYLDNANFYQSSKPFLTEVGRGIFKCKKEFYKYMSIQITSLTTQSVMIRRSSLMSLTVWFEEDFITGEDIDLWFRLANKFNIYFYKDVLCSYRKHGQGITANNINELKGSIDAHTRNFFRGEKQWSDKERLVYKKSISKNNFHLSYYYYKNKNIKDSKNHIKSSLHWNMTFSAYLLYCKIQFLALRVFLK